MPVLDHWKLDINVDNVLRAQGGDPDQMRKRSPRVIATTEWAMREGISLIKPVITFERYKVENFSHQLINLKGGGFLKGELVAEMLAASEEVLICVATIGKGLERRVSELMKDQVDNAYALDAFGTSAVDFLLMETCRYFEMEEKKRGLDVSSAISPGHTDWKLEEGQPQIFSLINSAEIGVELTSSMLMLPRKSTSFVLGVGKEVTRRGDPCDFCNKHETCIYQHRRLKETL